MANSTLYNNLFSSLISDIKAYNGQDPILPWLRGIRKMRDSLPPQLLKEKLPRFLQKCAQTFETDRRYKNDLRYLRVWLQLMDFVDDPGAVLGTMEANHIGRKRSLFYQARALYYEKMKKFEDAEKMYHLGVKNLAEPVNELQKSFEQFLHRMEQRKNKKMQRQGRRTTSRPLGAGSNALNCDEDKENNENMCRVKGRPTGNCLKESLPETQMKFEGMDHKVVLLQKSKNDMPMKESNCNGVAVNLGNVKVSSDPYVKKGDFGCKSYVKQEDSTDGELDEPRNFFGVDRVVGKFVDTATIGKSEVEDACHHGLVEPTINTKEAMNAINNMFREPLGPALAGRRSRRSEPKGNQSLKNGFEVFIDENLDNGVGSLNQNLEKGFSLPQYKKSETHQPLQEPFEIYIDNEESNDMKKRIPEKAKFEHRKVKKLTEGATVDGGHVNAFVFPNPKDLPSKCSEDLDVERSPQARLGEDTVVYRFVGSTISDEPKVENVCHHGLVEPTINLKEAMDDINSMFGKPIDFARKNRPKKPYKAPNEKRDGGVFLILPDDDLDHQQVKFQPSSSSKNDSDLFEPTVCTKDAMADINKMFGMPLDF